MLCMFRTITQLKLWFQLCEISRNNQTKLIGFLEPQCISFCTWSYLWTFFVTGESFCRRNVRLAHKIQRQLSLIFFYILKNYLLNKKFAYIYSFFMKLIDCKTHQTYWTYNLICQTHVMSSQDSLVALKSNDRKAE